MFETFVFSLGEVCKREEFKIKSLEKYLAFNPEFLVVKVKDRVEVSECFLTNQDRFNLLKAQKRLELDPVDNKILKFSLWKVTFEGSYKELNHTQNFIIYGIEKGGVWYDDGLEKRKLDSFVLVDKCSQLSLAEIFKGKIAEMVGGGDLSV